jgi:hypothetical protein
MPAGTPTTYYQSNPVVQYNARKKNKWSSTYRLGALPIAMNPLF